eukprot:1635355-Pyramimonas_sp.AAC.1
MYTLEARADFLDLRRGPPPLGAHGRRWMRRKGGPARPFQKIRAGLPYVVCVMSFWEYAGLFDVYGVFCYVMSFWEYAGLFDVQFHSVLMLYACCRSGGR